MKVGLYNVESKIVNSAMMRVSSYHKKRGDQVEFYNKIFHDSYDLIYAFSIFDFSPKDYVRVDMVKGGTGFDIKKRLPSEIETEEYDWSLYPDCDFSIIWFSEGCTNHCPFCVVPVKEGKIKSVNPKNLNPKGKYIKVMDNNFFANPKWEEAIEQLKIWNQPVDFQAIDVKMLDIRQAHILDKMKLNKQIKIAWDNPRENMIPHFQRILRAIPARKLMCYVLIGYWSTPDEDMKRVMILKNLGIDPFVMPYNKSDPYQKRFARWVNMKAVFKSVKWENYKNPVDEVKE
jgi:hypothetical protein